MSIKQLVERLAEFEEAMLESMCEDHDWSELFEAQVMEADGIKTCWARTCSRCPLIEFHDQADRLDS